MPKEPKKTPSVEFRLWKMTIKIYPGWLAALVLATLIAIGTWAQSNTRLPLDNINDTSGSLSTKSE